LSARTSDDGAGVRTNPERTRNIVYYLVTIVKKLSAREAWNLDCAFPFQRSVRLTCLGLR
jgi:hypothetical protein